jgi:hypothetical protein
MPHIVVPFGEIIWIRGKGWTVFQPGFKTPPHIPYSLIPLEMRSEIPLAEYLEAASALEATGSDPGATSTFGEGDVDPDHGKIRRWVLSVEKSHREDSATGRESGRVERDQEAPSRGQIGQW